MSWLRRQGIESFKRMNPKWDVAVLGRDPYSPIPGDHLAARAVRSDYARYKALAEHGGAYFDTDIIFYRPIPDEWLTVDLALPINMDGALVHVAALLGSERCPFFREALRRANERIAVKGPYGYQSLGVRMFRYLEGGDAMFETMPYLAKRMGLSFIGIPTRSFLPIPWDMAEMAFAPTICAKWPEGGIGLHWYGGDHAVMAIEPTVTEASLLKSQSLVLKAYEQSLLPVGT